MWISLVLLGLSSVFADDQFLNDRKEFEPNHPMAFVDSALKLTIRSSRQTFAFPLGVGPHSCRDVEPRALPGSGRDILRSVDPSDIDYFMCANRQWSSIERGLRMNATAPRFFDLEGVSQTIDIVVVDLRGQKEFSPCFDPNMHVDSIGPSRNLVIEAKLSDFGCEVVRHREVSVRLESRVRQSQTWRKEF